MADNLIVYEGIENCKNWVSQVDMEWKLVCTATPDMLSLPASQSQNSNTNHSMLVTPGKKSSGDDLRALAIGAKNSESLTGGSRSMAVIDCKNNVD